MNCNQLLFAYFWIGNRLNNLFASETAVRNKIVLQIVLLHGHSVPMCHMSSFSLASQRFSELGERYITENLFSYIKPSSPERSGGQDQR